MAPKKPTTEQAKSTLSAEAVLAYLEKNPNFLLQHPSLLEFLTPPSRHDGDKIVDMQNLMVRKLQSDNVKLRQTASEMVGIARGQIAAQQRVHSAVISLLSAISLDDVLHIITSDLVMHLGIDAVFLCIESDLHDELTEIMPGIQIVDPYYIDAIMGERTILMRSDIPGDPNLFGSAAAMVRSDALVRLFIGDGSHDGLLVLGSRKIDAFHAAFGGELLVFLGQIVEITLRSWLARYEE